MLELYRWGRPRKSFCRDGNTANFSITASSRWESQDAKKLPCLFGKSPASRPPPPDHALTEWRGGQTPLDLSNVEQLLSFARGSALVEWGFGHLNDHGKVDSSLPVSTLVTARMTFCFSIASELGIHDVSPIVHRGISALNTQFFDDKHGGFRSFPPGHPDSKRKSAYDMSFVLLAASTAFSVGFVEAERAIEEALKSLEKHFWREDLGVLWNSFNEDFTEREAYIGANSNMHAVEALMAAGKALNDSALTEKARRISSFMIRDKAQMASWMLPEHYDSEGQALLDFNVENPKDEFQPYGVTIGHLFEWSRLLLELRCSAQSDSEWMTSSAAHLYQTARKMGWATDGKEGFLYTLDWEGKPVVDHRLLWVAAEAISAAGEMKRIGLVDGASSDLETWQNYLKDSFVDAASGGWHHELDSNGRPSSSIARGKPDAYHLLHAFLVPQLPAGSGLLDRIRNHAGGLHNW